MWSSMDKSWIDKPQNIEGLNKFLDFTFADQSVDSKMPMS